MFDYFIKEAITSVDSLSVSRTGILHLLHNKTNLTLQELKPLLRCNAPESW
jgi:hypothetical protein